MQDGFSLIEMLVSVLIFIFVILAVYAFFDQGQWLYLHSEKRANIQDITRGTMQDLERDLRKIGFGVPTGGNDGGGTTWLPFIFHAGGGSIYFRADLDSGNTMLRVDATGGTSLDVQDPTRVCPPMPANLVLTESGRTWKAITCTSYSGNVMTVTPTFTVPAVEGEVFSPEHVFYRLAGDADDDGNCDNITDNDYPFCTIEKVVTTGNDPVANSAVPASGWSQVGANIVQMKFTYLEADGSPATSPLTAQVVHVDLRARDRGSDPKGRRFQDVNLTTDILVRDSRY